MVKIQYLESSIYGLKWLKQYFKTQQQLNSKEAFNNFAKARALLKQAPLSGHIFDEIENVRELKIQKSAFSILYTFKRNIIYIIDIRDQRSTRSAEALTEFLAKLKKKYDL